MENNYTKRGRSVYSLTVQMVFVTKYRKKVITQEMLESLKNTFISVLDSWDSQLIEFNGESDYVHLLVSFPPTKTLSNMIANLKATTSKRMWQKYQPHLGTYYHKKVFWTGAYFVASCGGVTIDRLKKYVEDQKPCP